MNEREPGDLMLAVGHAIVDAEEGKPVDVASLRARLTAHADQLTAFADDVDAQMPEGAAATRKLADFARRLVAVVDYLEAGDAEEARTEFRFALHASMSGGADQIEGM